ncbi:hypothetical protein LTR37_019503 [Vermiconidia calcicola]|uniref:Uncharacterized protein n=1 Tax=Vermiconidia calcicola TaxID=1690605 RepID=A0ACC3MDW5_9PEZI|nr:hypothetical protein LTR37_019503 [Vermiconidia calcicola]
MLVTGAATMRRNGNHYANGKRSQEAYVWPTVAEASRRAISIRYSLLSYIYTLFYYAHTRGDTVMRALAWEFPDDISLRETDTQFLLGPSILVTPVLEPNASTVKGVFPGIEDGTRWYDWYTLREVKGVMPHENVTMAAPLEHINVHVRGGSIIPLQLPGNTTKTTKESPYSLLVVPDNRGCAVGTLYVDDGESIKPNATKLVEFSYVDGKLTTRSWGGFYAAAPLANITILGVYEQPEQIELRVGIYDYSILTYEHVNETLRVTGLERYTRAGAWESAVILDLLRADSGFSSQPT